MPNILIRNDDEIHAPRPRALVEGPRGFAEITAVTPARERRGQTNVNPA
jgi:broad specificity polyphosphatase/5'/3'-nucleotidase SurE